MKSNQTKQKNQGTHYCSLPMTKERIFNENVSPFREELILISHKKWANGTTLKYYFFDNESDGQWVYYTNGTKEWKTWKGSNREKKVVRNAFKEWKSIGIGLNFKEVNEASDSDIRIGFMKGDGSWSYVGRDILRQGIKDRTMNFGWNVENDSDTVLHEIGHTLGFPHAHQNPKAGIVWDEEAVYKELGGYPNYWNREKTYHNIIRKIPVDMVQGSNWDPNSIMQYPFKPGLIKKPEEYNQNGLYPTPGLSEKDILWVKFFYPELSASDFTKLSPARSANMDLEFGQQKNFTFTPNSSRKFNIKTFGESDGVMVLFKKGTDDELIYLSADDDSGEDKNAEIQHKLLKGEEYVVSYRQYYNSGKESAIMVY